MKLNIGCGWRDFGKDWIHIDGGNYDHLDSDDIFVTEYKNNSVDLIYASHFIEYFDRQEVAKLLQRWKEVLKPNGILRLAVPNFEALVEVYKVTSDLNKILGPLYGRMEINNGNKILFHKTCYDFNSLKFLLEENGFKNIKLYDWRETEHSQFDDHSQAYFPHLDKENGLLVSLNIECQKI